MSKNNKFNSGFILYTDYVKLLKKKIGIKNSIYNDQLEKIGSNLIGKKFLGVYPSDSIPKYKNNTYLIFNVDKKNEKLETIVGSNTQIEGNVTTKGTLRIDGRLTGDVETDWLILGEKAFLKGNVKVAGVAVAGYLEGNVVAKEIIELKRTGQIQGDVTTNKLVVIEGGIVDGKIAMQQKEGGKVVELTQEVRSDSK